MGGSGGVYRARTETRRIYYTLTHKDATKQADKLLALARQHGGGITARDAARLGAGGRTTEEVEKVMAGLIAAGMAEWHVPVQPKGGRPTRYFRLKSAAASAAEMPPAPRN